MRLIEMEIDIISIYICYVSLNSGGIIKSIYIILKNVSNKLTSYIYSGLLYSKSGVIIGNTRNDSTIVSIGRSATFGTEIKSDTPKSNSSEPKKLSTKKFQGNIQCI